VVDHGWAQSLLADISLDLYCSLDAFLAAALHDLVNPTFADLNPRE